VITNRDDAVSTLDIDTVQAFLLVAELQSFTRAAEALGTTQAAVSLKLQRLESVLGKRLVERSPRAVTLTAGRMVADLGGSRGAEIKIFVAT
jgi:DNA-binding transcriptional LysR family regulator